MVALDARELNKKFVKDKNQMSAREHFIDLVAEQLDIPE